MASTTFIDQQTVIYASWLNDVNNAVYNGTFPNGVLNVTTINATSANFTNATIDNLTADIGTLVLSNDWSIVAGATKVSFIHDGTTVASIDTSGNLVLLGSSTTGGTP